MMGFILRRGRSTWWVSRYLTCSVHWKWHCICHADQWWVSFCVAGTKIVSKIKPGRSPKRRVRNNSIVGSSWDHARIVFLLAEALHWVAADILTLKISWQGQCVVRLEGDFACSAYWQWRFICDADYWCDFFCVAVGEVGGWLLLLRALKMTFYISYGLSMRFVLCGRRKFR